MTWLRSLETLYDVGRVNSTEATSETRAFLIDEVLRDLAKFGCIRARFAKTSKVTVASQQVRPFLYTRKVGNRVPHGWYGYRERFGIPRDLTPSLPSQDKHPLPPLRHAEVRGLELRDRMHNLIADSPNECHKVL